MLAAFLALRLNGGVDDTIQQTLLDANTWKRIEGDAPREGRPVYGLDLGQSEAMAAISAYWPDSGRLECVASFPTIPSLAERGLADGVGNLYVQMAQRGELVQTGGEAIDIEHLLREALERFGAPTAMAADRWRVAELRDILRRMRFPVVPLHERGQGFKDGGEDVREFRRACCEGRVTPSPSLLLSAAMGEARTISDPAGNSKLSKKTEGGRRAKARDDAAAAAILAVAIGARRAKRPPRRGWRHAVAG